MDYKVKLSTKAPLQPNAAAARRLVNTLRQIGAPPQIIEIAEKTAEAAEQTANAKTPEHQVVVSK